MNLTGNHIRAARGLLDMRQAQLAKLADVSLETVRSMERAGTDPIGGYERTRDAVREALESQGIVSLNGGSPGVRLRPRRKGWAAVRKFRAIAN